MPAEGSSQIEGLGKLLKLWITGAGAESGLSKLVLPETAHRAHQLTSDPKATLDQMSGVLEKDPVCASKVLQVARSVLYYRGRAVDTLREAVVRIGLEGCRNVVFVLAMRSQIARGTDKAIAERMWKHSVGTGAATQALAGHIKMAPDTAFLAGLLHDIGRFAGWQAFMDLRMRNAQLRALSLDEVEAAVTLVHEEGGAHLLKRWAVGDKIVDAVAKHHSPPTGKELKEVVGLAENLAKEAGWANEVQPTMAPLEPYLAALGVNPTEMEAIRKRMIDSMSAFEEISFDVAM